MRRLTYQCKKWICVFFTLLAALINYQIVYAQYTASQDSSTTSSLPAGHTPGKTLIRALIVPGWGQIYNRQYLKASIYYAGLTGGTYFVVNSNRNYLIYRHAALYAAYKDVSPEDRPEGYRERFVNDYNKARDLNGLGPENELSEEEQIAQRQSLAPTLRNFRDQFRRRRDLNILITFAVWGIGVIESYVSAHLLHFDVSEDLTIRFLPHPQGVEATVYITF